MPRRLLLSAVAAAALACHPGPVAAAEPVFVGSANVDEPLIALTFDDGYDAGATRDLFALLVELDVPATFFPYAEAVAADPELWTEIAARSRLANHSLSHADLTDLSLPELRRELRTSSQMIASSTGRPVMRVLRAPFGLVDERVLAEAGEAGFRLVLDWSIDSRDWAGITASEVTRRSIGGQAGDVVLLHAGPRATVEALPAIVAHYRQRGFRFVTIDELFAPALRAPVCRAVLL